MQGGFHLADRNSDEFKRILGPLTATGSNEAAVAAEWDKQRNLLEFLYSTPAYWPSLELFGWQDKGEQLFDMTRSGEWHKIALSESPFPCLQMRAIMHWRRKQFVSYNGVVFH